MAAAEEDGRRRVDRARGDVRAEVRATSGRTHQPRQHLLRQLTGTNLVPQRLAQVRSFLIC